MRSAIEYILFQLNAIFLNRIVVNQRNYKSTLCGEINPNKEYFIDGIIRIDNSNYKCVVPSRISIKGYDFDTSQIISEFDDYTFFVSDAGGNGNILLTDVGFEMSGSNSQVYDLEDIDGTHAIECNRVNFNNCTSLGELNGFRQLLENGTGRFGGTPNLILSGTWSGGARVTTSIARGIDDAMSGAIFEAGTGFSMSGRFKSDLNIDLGSSAALLDFAPSNFVGSDRLQLTEVEVSRNGVFDSSDTTITPNISHTDIESYWTNNIGVPNTIVGGVINIDTEVETVIVDPATYYDLAGTASASDLQHFDSPSNGVLRYLSDTSRDFEIKGHQVLRGTANDVIDIKVVVYRDATATDEDHRHIERVLNNLSGPINRAYYTLFDTFRLNKNDTVRLQTENVFDDNNVTAETDSFFILKAS